MQSTGQVSIAPGSFRLLVAVLRMGAERPQRGSTKKVFSSQHGARVADNADTDGSSTRRLFLPDRTPKKRSRRWHWTGPRGPSGAEARSDGSITKSQLVPAGHHQFNAAVTVAATGSLHLKTFLSGGPAAIGAQGVALVELGQENASHRPRLLPEGPGQFTQLIS